MSEAELTIEAVAKKLEGFETVRRWLFGLLAACFAFGAWLTKNTMELNFLVERLGRVEKNEAQNTDKLGAIGQDLAGMRSDIVNLRASVDDLRQLLRSKQ